MSKLDDLSSLVDASDTDAIWDEARHTLGLFIPDEYLPRLGKVYAYTVDLFNGKVPGYRECNTGYHDLRHTTDVFLAMTRLLHGMSLSGCSPLPELVEPSLAAALLHDVGYIQQAGDNHGTGGKYTLSHIKRGMEFAKRYLPSAGFAAGDVHITVQLISATSLTVNFDNLSELGPPELSMAKALFNADIVGQMADRVYLEKLLFLYREFMESNINEYATEEELLEKTLDFYQSVWKKILEDGEYDTQHMKAHFRQRWGDDRDLYARAIDNNMQYLRRILDDGQGGRYRDFLKREGMVDRLRQIERGNT